jgi:hypothetical protein
VLVGDREAEAARKLARLRLGALAERKRSTSSCSRVVANRK